MVIFDKNTNRLLRWLRESMEKPAFNKILGRINLVGDNMVAVNYRSMFAAKLSHANIKFDGGVPPALHVEDLTANVFNIPVDMSSPDDTAAETGNMRTAVPSLLKNDDPKRYNQIYPDGASSFTVDPAVLQVALAGFEHVAHITVHHRKNNGCTIEIRGAGKFGVKAYAAVAGMSNPGNKPYWWTPFEDMDESHRTIKTHIKKS